MSAVTDSVALALYRSGCLKVRHVQNQVGSIKPLLHRPCAFTLIPERTVQNRANSGGRNQRNYGF